MKMKMSSFWLFKAVKSGDVDVSFVYRIENGAAAGVYMMKKSFHDKFIKNQQVSLWII